MTTIPLTMHEPIYESQTPRATLQSQEDQSDDDADQGDASNAPQGVHVESTEEMIWSLTWTNAFPTLLPQQLYNPSRPGMHGNGQIQVRSRQQASALHLQKLAFDAIFRSSRNPSADAQHWMNDRDRQSMENSLGYGEISPKSVLIIMELLQSMDECNSRRGRGKRMDFRQATVMDLGSGNGRVLFAACLCQPFREAIGLEILPELHGEAMKNLEAWDEQAQGTDDAAPATHFDFRCDDFTHHVALLQSASVVFIHATVFQADLMSKLQIMCEGCSPGTYFICVTNPVNGVANIRTLTTVQLDMNWGQATVYIQQMVGGDVSVP